MSRSQHAFDRPRERLLLLVHAPRVRVHAGPHEELEMAQGGEAEHSGDGDDDGEARRLLFPKSVDRGVLLAAGAVQTGADTGYGAGVFLLRVVPGV